MRRLHQSSIVAPFRLTPGRCRSTKAKPRHTVKRVRESDCVTAPRHLPPKVAQRLSKARSRTDVSDEVLHRTAGHTLFDGDLSTDYACSTAADDEVIDEVGQSVRREFHGATAIKHNQRLDWGVICKGQPFRPPCAKGRRVQLSVTELQERQTVIRAVAAVAIQVGDIHRSLYQTCCHTSSIVTLFRCEVGLLKERRQIRAVALSEVWIKAWVDRHGHSDRPGPLFKCRRR